MAIDNIRAVSIKGKRLIVDGEGRLVIEDYMRWEIECLRSGQIEWELIPIIERSEIEEIHLEDE